MANLYLHKSLVKAAQLPTSADRGVGSQRGGNYVARVQVGYGKDNKPKYRYFKTPEEYKAYQEQQSTTTKEKKKKGDKKEGTKRLEEKTEKEKTKKQGSSVFVKDKDKKVQKSIALFIEVSDE